MKIKIISISVFCLLFLVGASLAQNAIAADSERLPISFLIKAYNDSIVGRILIGDIDLLDKIQESGYYVIRTSFDLDKSEIHVQRDTLFGGAAIMAKTATEISKIGKEKSRDFAERYHELVSQEITTQAQLDQYKQARTYIPLAINLLASEDNQFADYFGLRFVDNDVEVGAEYVYSLHFVDFSYRVYGAIPSVVINEMKPIPPPTVADRIESNESITIKWDFYKHYDRFYAYNIERSTDNVHFVKLNDNPLLKIFDEKIKGDKFQVYQDSVANDIQYYYRLSGISYFGDDSEPSMVVPAKAKDDIAPAAPVIRDVDYDINTRKTNITWRPGKQAEDYKQTMIVLTSGSAIVDSILIDDAFQDSYLYQWTADLTPDTMLYVQVCYMDESGNAGCSFARDVFVPDMSPPAIPSGLTGDIDTMGVVTLTWDANQEQDLWGYYIYTRNDTLSNYVRITDTPYVSNIFYDTVSIKSLTNDRYYRIVALDVRVNISDYSDPIVVRKPDLVPPSAAVFLDYARTEVFITFSWAPSSFADVAEQMIERQEGEVWKVVASLDPTVSMYKDISVVPGATYTYRIKTVDHSGNTSLSPTELQLQLRVIKELKSPVLNIKRKKGLPVLSWTDVDGNIKEVLVYKKTKSSKKGLAFYTKFDYESDEWMDEKGNLDDRYAIRLVGENGLRSRFSNIIQL